MKTARKSSKTATKKVARRTDKKAAHEKGESIDLQPQTPAPVLSAGALQTRAMLVSLRISAWSGRKFDRVATQQVEQKNEVQNVGRFNKQLLAGARELHKDVMSSVMGARQSYYRNTLSWSDEGWRLLPAKNYFEFRDLLRDAQTEFHKSVDEFVNAYPELREKAREQLKGLYRVEEYPDPSQIRGKFDFSVKFMPLPAEGDFRLDLPQDQIKSIEQAAIADVTSALQEAMKDAWTRLHECVSHIHDRLKDTDAIFRDSLVSNARELVDVLGRLNVTNDPALDDMRAKVLDLTKVEPQTLRDDKVVRNAVALEADALLQQMVGIFGGAQ
jgi:hypothetical protein